MKESMWGYLIISLGLVIISVLLLVQRLTTTNEEDFYLGREVMEASMIDAIDYGTYRSSGELVMSKEKFVEVFIRRFAESVTPNKTYTLDFYDIHEYPPKATVRIRTTSGSTEIKSDSFEVNIDTFLSGILETVWGNGNLKNITKSTNLPMIEEEFGEYGFGGADEDEESSTSTEDSYCYNHGGDSICKYAISDTCTNGICNMRIQYYSTGFITGVTNSSPYLTSNGKNVSYTIKYSKLSNEISASDIINCSYQGNTFAVNSSVSGINAYFKQKEDLNFKLLNEKGAGIETSSSVMNSHRISSSNVSNPVVSCKKSGNQVLVSLGYKISNVDSKLAIKQVNDVNGNTISNVVFTPVKYQINLKYYAKSFSN